MTCNCDECSLWGVVPGQGISVACAKISRIGVVESGRGSEQIVWRAVSVWKWWLGLAAKETGYESQGQPPLLRVHDHSVRPPNGSRFSCGRLARQRH